MKLVLPSFYNLTEKMDISYKVFKFIRKTLIAEVMQPFGLDKILPDTFLSILDTSQVISSVDVLPPKLEDNHVQHYLILPYQPIASAENYEQAFLDYYFEGLTEIFTTYYNVPAEAIQKVKAICEKELVGNPLYAYEEIAF